MLKYVMAKFLPHHMNSILVEACDAFKVSAINIVRKIFVQTNLPPLRLTNFTTNNQVCVASIQVSSGAKSEDINGISHRNDAPTEVQEIRIYDPMLVLQEHWIQQSSMNIVL